MEDYVVTHTKKTRQGVSHVVFKPDGGGTETIRYGAIRAGLNWPRGEMMAYHCILGEEFVYKRDDKRHRGRLRLLSEREYPNVSIDKVFSSVTDDLALMLCTDIYTNVEEAQDFYEAYEDYRFRKKAGAGRLDRAPFADNFHLGLALIRDWKNEGRLILPEKSIVREQLKRIARIELDPQKHPERKFHAVNGLRYAVGAFHKFLPARRRRRRRRGRAMAI